jgi:hypothetical protein
VAQEHLAASWARLTGGVAVGLRYHNVYGPRMPRDTPYSGVAAIFRSCLENGVPPRVFEDGGQRRDFIHVRDVARANLLALSAVGGLAGGGGQLDGSLRCYNVASGEPHTVGEMASALAGRVRRLRSGGIEPVVTGEYRLGDVRHIVASPDGAARDLGFRAQTRFAAAWPSSLAPRCGSPPWPGSRAFSGLGFLSSWTGRWAAGAYATTTMPHRGAPDHASGCRPAGSQTASMWLRAVITASCDIERFHPSWHAWLCG